MTWIDVTSFWILFIFLYHFWWFCCICLNPEIMITLWDCNCPYLRQFRRKSLKTLKCEVKDLDLEVNLVPPVYQFFSAEPLGHWWDNYLRGLVCLNSSERIKKSSKLICLVLFQISVDKRMHVCYNCPKNV